MLIDRIVDFCDNQYSNQDTYHICKTCKHPSQCSGNCKNCLEEIHYPNKYPNGKKDYDCSNLINFYVCDYSFKYASEILYLLRKCESLNNIDNYHIMSIGCGGCPDLMAFESFIEESHLNKRISYIGIDINELWEPIHNQIKTYKTNNIKNIQFIYVDAIQYFDEMTIKDANVLILQYVISHFYNTNQISEIEAFFDQLIDSIIKYKEQNKPFVIIINDVNSNNRGRDYFLEFCEKLKARNFHGIYNPYYFDYNIKNSKQCYGMKHESNDVLYSIPNKLKKYEPWRKCSSAQLLIEVTNEVE